MHKTPHLTLSGDTTTIRCMAFSPSGQYLVVSHKSGTLHIWDAKTGRFIKSYEEPLGKSPKDEEPISISTVGIRNDGTAVACGGEFNNLRCWISTSNELFLVKEGGRPKLNCGGTLLAVLTSPYGGGGSVSRDSSVIVWNVNAKKKVNTLIHLSKTSRRNTSMNDFSIPYFGDVIACLGKSWSDNWIAQSTYEIVTYHLTNNPLQISRCYSGESWRFGVSCDGRTIVFSDDHQTKFSDNNQNLRESSLIFQGEATNNEFLFSKDKMWVIFCADEGDLEGGKVTMVSLPDLRPLNHMDFHTWGKTSRITMDRDNNILAAGRIDGTIGLWWLGNDEDAEIPNNWKTETSRRQKEELERIRQEEEQERNRLEHEDEQRRQALERHRRAAEEQIARVDERRKAGMCIWCGNPLSWLDKTLYSDHHRKCGKP